MCETERRIFSPRIQREMPNTSCLSERNGKIRKEVGEKNKEEEEEEDEGERKKKDDEKQEEERKEEKDNEEEETEEKGSRRPRSNEGNEEEEDMHEKKRQLRANRRTDARRKVETFPKRPNCDTPGKPFKGDFIAHARARAFETGGRLMAVKDTNTAGGEQKKKHHTWQKGLLSHA